MADHRHAVLVAEDDWGTREAFIALLETDGYEVVGVENGREALDRLRAGFCPCLIVLDIAMPEMDGFAFRRAQLADDDLAGIPAIVMSGRGRDAQRDADALGMGLLTKPAELKDVRAAVHRHCRAPHGDPREREKA